MKHGPYPHLKCPRMRSMFLGQGSFNFSWHLGTRICFYYLIPLHLLNTFTMLGSEQMPKHRSFIILQRFPVKGQRFSHSIHARNLHLSEVRLLARVLYKFKSNCIKAWISKLQKGVIPISFTSLPENKNHITSESVEWRVLKEKCWYNYISKSRGTNGSQWHATKTSKHSFMKLDSTKQIYFWLGIKSVVKKEKENLRFEKSDPSKNQPHVYLISTCWRQVQPSQDDIPKQIYLLANQGYI